MTNSSASVQASREQGNTMVIVLVGAVILVAAAAFYFMNNNNPAGSGPNTNDAMMEQSATPSDAMMENDSTMATSPTVDPAQAMTVDEDGTKVVTVEAGSFYYTPNVIRVKKGDAVKVILNSVDMMHDFKIDELDVASEVVPAGESGEVEFTADTVGEFEYYCSVGQHRANGMVGTLIVEE